MIPKKLNLGRLGKHVPIVLKVVEKDPHGRATKCEVIYDEQVTHIEGGEEFIVAWWPASVVKKVVLS